MLVFAFEALAVVLFAAVMVTQVIVPLATGRHVFPALRHRDVRAQIDNLEETQERTELERQRDRLQTRINRSQEK